MPNRPIAVAVLVALLMLCGMAAGQTYTTTIHHTDMNDVCQNNQATYVRIVDQQDGVQFYPEGTSSCETGWTFDYQFSDWNNNQNYASMYLPSHGCLTSTMGIDGVTPVCEQGGPLTLEGCKSTWPTLPVPTTFPVVIVQDYTITGCPNGWSGVMHTNFLVQRLYQCHKYCGYNIVYTREDGWGTFSGN